MTAVEVTTNPGLEDVVSAEWMNRMTGHAGVATQICPGGAAGRVHLFADVTDIVEHALSMRAVHHVLRIVATFPLHTDDPLGDIRARLRDIDIVELHPPDVRFRVTSERNGRHSFTSTEVQNAAGAGILDRARRPVRMKGYDVCVRCDVRVDEVRVTVQHTRHSLNRRHDRPFRPRTALGANVAWGLLWLTRPPSAPARRFLDPCCGSGTLLLEAAELWPAVEACGSDSAALCVDGARENLVAAHTHAQVELADARELSATWNGAPFDTVVSNLPFGRRLGVQFQPYWFVRDLLQSLLPVTTPDARVGLLTLHARDISRVLAAGAPWRQVACRTVDMGGLRAQFVLLERLPIDA